MVKGILFALSACFIWGLIFVVPEFMNGFSPIEVALGRYTFYGAISLLIFSQSRFQGCCEYSLLVWRKALHFSLVSTLGYYTFVVLSMRYASPAICALILGICPITIAFYGNWLQREISFRSLIVPSLLILAGLLIINVPQLEASASPSNYLMGVGFGLIALMAWSWYVVANSKFLKKYPDVHSSDWSTLIGVATLFWVGIFALILVTFFQDQVHTEKYLTLNKDLKIFFVGSAILGLLCSWVGAFFWNKACLSLPVSLAGQLTVFETIFGVLFVYIVNQTYPSLLESIGIVVLLLAIVYGIGKFAQSRPDSKEAVVH